jgi:hypothetical protein
VSAFSEEGRSLTEYNRIGERTMQISLHDESDESDRSCCLVEVTLDFLAGRERSSLVARGRFRGGGLMGLSREDIYARVLQKRARRLYFEYNETEPGMS